jgi:hypothetical protein
MLDIFMCFNYIIIIMIKTRKKKKKKKKKGERTNEKRAQFKIEKQQILCAPPLTYMCARVCVCVYLIQNITCIYFIFSI